MSPVDKSADAYSKSTTPGTPGGSGTDTVGPGSAQEVLKQLARIFEQFQQHAILQPRPLVEKAQQAADEYKKLRSAV